MTTESTVDARLGAFPTSVLSDALDELGIPGALAGLSAQRQGQGRIAGRALPVRFVRKSGDPQAYRFGGGVGKPLEKVLQNMQAGHVVVMDLDGAPDAAAWGGLASRLAQRRGVRGTVMWGACRDLEEIRAIGYPVWAVGVCPRRSRNAFAFGSIGEPLAIQGIAICASDFIVADESGVVCVPGARANEVLDLALRIERQEALLLAQVRDDAVACWDQI